MAKKQQSGTVSYGLPESTIIEVIRTKGDEAVKKEMTYGEWITMKKLPGYNYSAFQKGFSQYKLK